MPSHIMLSYQWDHQDLVKKIYQRLTDDGLPVWMDIHGGVTGNINDAMAAGVEDAAVICPFLTPAYQASRNCKKELNYADSREVIIVPIMVADEWEASEWLGLLTAGLLWVDFRNADAEQFEVSVRSLEEEILFNAGHLLTLEERPQQEDQPPTPQPRLNSKRGRRFCHALSKLYIHDAGESLLHVYPDIDVRNAVELTDTPGDPCYWEEIKADGCKYYRNVETSRYLGFDPGTDRLHSEDGPSETEEWLLLVDRTDQSHRRAVVIKNKRSQRFLAVQNGCFAGLQAYSEDCRWYLE